ncbi:MAG: GxxExxY protein [Chloroflexota bacterium]
MEGAQISSDGRRPDPHPDYSSTPEHSLTEQVIGAAIEVHRHLGPGLLEAVYQACLARELTLRQVPFEQEVPLPVEYKGVRLDCGYRLDFVVGGTVVVELKAVDELRPVHEAQLMTYLKVTGCRVGLLVNFNVSALKQGLRRKVI